MVKNLRYILLLSFICIINCIIEIPIKVVNVGGNPYLGDIKINGHSIGIRNYKGKTGKIFLDNRAYLCTLTLGSNQQQFNVLLDTGSFLMYVAKVGSKDQIPIKHHYDPSKSSTAVKTGQPFNIQYVTGACSGYRYYDYISYINNKKFKMLFGAADQTALHGKEDGIIGLGHYYNNKEISFIEMLKKGGVTTSRAFSFKLERGLDDGTPGKLLIGRHKDFQNPKCAKMRLNQNSPYWEGPINGLILKNSRGQASSRRKFNPIFDTGTNDHYLPHELLQDLKNQLRSINCEPVNLGQNQYGIACSDVPDLKLNIGGKTLTIPKEFNYRGSEQGYAVTSFIFTQTMGHYIIGSYLMMVYHTLHDPDTESMTFCPLHAK